MKAQFAEQEVGGGADVGVAAAVRQTGLQALRQVVEQVEGWICNQARELNRGNLDGRDIERNAVVAADKKLGQGAHTLRVHPLLTVLGLGLLAAVQLAGQSWPLGSSEHHSPEVNL